MTTETLAVTEDSKQRATRVIDLRSDTVTRPTAAMRAAMATAEVGDDVYGEDPTLNLLGQKAAAIFEREAAIFVPTGTMGNQVAIRLHTQHGQEVICESKAHIHEWEMAMASAFSGCQLRAVYANRGILTWKDIQTGYRREDLLPRADGAYFVGEHAQHGRRNCDSAARAGRDLGWSCEGGPANAS